MDDPIEQDKLYKQVCEEAGIELKEEV
jgi:hypothetical protein